MREIRTSGLMRGTRHLSGPYSTNSKTLISNATMPKGLTETLEAARKSRKARTVGHNHVDVVHAVLARREQKTPPVGRPARLRPDVEASREARDGVRGDVYAVEIARAIAG